MLKYTRSRSSLPAKTIRDLVQEVSREFVPICVKADDTIEDAEDRDLSITEFFVKSPVTGSSYDYRFHVCSSDSVDEIACKREITPEFSHIGSVLPDPKLLCKLCAKARLTGSRS